MVKRANRKINAKNRIDERLLLAYLLILIAGLVTIYSTSSMIAESRFGSHIFFLKQQFIWAMLSLCALFIICRIDLKRFAVFSAPALLLTIGLLAIVFLMPARNGSHRWLFFGPITIQPSELFKIILIYYLAFSLSNRERNVADYKEILYRYVPIIAVGLLLIVLEPDLGTTIVIALTTAGLFFLAGARIKHLLVVAVPSIAAAAFLVFVVGYKKARIFDYIEAILDPLKGSYQSSQAALTLGSGGLFGVGLGDGRQKLFFLPYPHTDFIFAAIGEEVGMIGLLILLVLFFYVLMRGMRIASAQPDRFGYLLASGIVISLFINIAVNLGVVTSLLPVTGLALPFMSYGGSSLLISSASVGVLLNLSRRVV